MKVPPFKPVLRKLQVAEAWVARLNLTILLAIFTVLAWSVSSLVKYHAPSTAITTVVWTLALFGLLIRGEMNALGLKKTRHDIKDELNGVSATANAASATIEHAAKEIKETTEEVKKATNGNLHKHLEEVKQNLEECVKQNPLAYVQMQDLAPLLRQAASEICASNKDEIKRAVEEAMTEHELKCPLRKQADDDSPDQPAQG